MTNDLIKKEYTFKGTPENFISTVRQFGEGIGYRFWLPREKVGISSQGFARNREIVPLPSASYASINFDLMPQMGTMSARTLPKGRSSSLLILLPPPEYSLPPIKGLPEKIHEETKESHRQQAKRIHQIWDMLLAKMQTEGWLEQPKQRQNKPKMTVNTRKKIAKLLEIRKNYTKNGKVNIDLTAACRIANRLDTKTLAVHAPEIIKHWLDTDREFSEFLELLRNSER